jgi:hypothetical protein
MKIASTANPNGYSGIGGADVVVVVTTGVKIAETVTGLFGMVKAQGLLELPPEHDAPVMLQLENCQLAEGVAVTEIDEPTASEHPLGQFGETDPEPEATFVVKVAVAGLTIKVNVPVTDALAPC